MSRGQKPPDRIDLDELDQQIISLLQQDGRRSHADMARTVGKSIQTVRNRIDRLVAAGVIELMAVLNPPALGLEREVVIGLRVKQGCLKTVGDRLAAMEMVSYVAFLAGSVDILIEVLLRDDEDLFHFLRDVLGGIDEILGSETWTVLHTQKYNHAWANPLSGSPGVLG
jgi:Lrp/AsnC family transcriptional regulator, regulator for asnA, asnC and gidA